MKLSQEGSGTEPESLGKRLSPRRADREEAVVHVGWPPLDELVNCCCGGRCRQACCGAWRCAHVRHWLSLASVMERAQPYMAYTVSYLAKRCKSALRTRQADATAYQAGAANAQSGALDLGTIGACGRGPRAERAAAACDGARRSGTLAPRASCFSPSKAPRAMLAPLRIRATWPSDSPTSQRIASPGPRCRARWLVSSALRLDVFLRWST